MYRSIRWILLLGFYLLAGCAHKPSQPRPLLVPESAADSQSGPAGTSQGAQPIPARQDAAAHLDVFEASGEVSWPAHRRTAWLLLTIEHLPPADNPPLRCRLSYKPLDAVLNIDAFNQMGTPLPAQTDSAAGVTALDIPLTGELGDIRFRIRAARPQDAARFSLHCVWQATPPEEMRSHCCAIHPKWKHPDPVDPIAEGLEGRIVSTQTIGGRLVLNLDKGSDSGIAVGMEGVVLDGKSGREPLDEGAFRVLEISAQECVVVSQLKKLAPRNIRVVFLTKH